MDRILTVLGGILGIVVPVLFAFALRQGVARSPLGEAQKASCRTTIDVGITLWTAVIWIASWTHLLDYHAGDAWPRIALPLFLPVIVALAMLLHPTARTIIDSIPAATLIGVQAFRLAGFVFLIIPGLGHLPPAFVSGGYGDIATGLLAIVAGLALARNSSHARSWFVLFSAVGLGDLLNVAGLLFWFYPSWSHAVPSSAALADFSLVMVPALAAPIALILHCYALRSVFVRRHATVFQRVR
ncbi:MAG: hypothetical protein JWO05_3843 [Gemmatimonadetes bacterium]|nr:hypothetical protein [Gemmatimonadota bacterium]